MMHRGLYSLLAATWVLLAGAGNVVAQDPSALFENTNANLWLVDPGTGRLTSYSDGEWLSAFTQGGSPVYSLADSQQALVNGLPNSSTNMTPGQPSLSLAGLGKADFDLNVDGQVGDADLRMSPEEGSYSETVVVELRVNAALFSSSSVFFKYTVNGGSEQSYIVDTSFAEASGQLQDGYFVAEIPLAANDTYVIAAELRSTPSSPTVLAQLSQSYTIDVTDVRRDSDGDGIPDIVEAEIGLDPFTSDHNSDSDGDGWSDFDEWLREFCLDENLIVSAGIDCLDAEGNPRDSDYDSWSDFDEQIRGTNPYDALPDVAGLDLIQASAVLEASPQSVADFNSVTSAAFCLNGDETEFDIEITAKSDWVIFGIGTLGFPFGSATDQEIFRVNFDEFGNYDTYGPSREVRAQVTKVGAGIPPNDLWLDGLLDDFTLDILGDGTYRLRGTISAGTEPFVIGDEISGVYVRSGSGSGTTSSAGPFEIEACAGEPPPLAGDPNLELEEFRKAQRFKDFPAATRLYEVEHVIVGGTVVTPPAADIVRDNKVIDQGASGSQEAVYADNVVQSFVSTADNLARVDIKLISETDHIDEITLNVWADPLRESAPLVSRTLQAVPVRTNGTIAEFRFAPVATTPGQTYYLEFRKGQSLPSFPAKNDGYTSGALVEADGASLSNDPGDTLLSGQVDLSFITYTDTAFNNGLGGTPAGMIVVSAGAVDVFGNVIYDSTGLVDEVEVGSVGLTLAEVSERRQRAVYEAALAVDGLPEMRLSAGKSVIVNAVHFAPSDTAVDWQPEPAYSRLYKSWLPAISDVTPADLLATDDQSWTTADEFRQSFVDYLVAGLTVTVAPVLTADSTAAVMMVEAALTEESRLQQSGVQIFAAGAINRDLVEDVEDRLALVAMAPYSLDQMLLDVEAAVLTGQPLQSLFADVRSLFYLAMPGSRSDSFAADYLLRNYDSSCFVPEANLNAILASQEALDDLRDRCPEYFDESGLSVRLAAEQEQRYLLRLSLLPGGLSKIAGDASLLDVVGDSDTDQLLNVSELNQPAPAVTLPWLADTDGDGLSDLTDGCVLDPFNQCVTNRILPVVSLGDDVSVTEPGQGSNELLIRVSLDRLYDETVSIGYEVKVEGADDATPGADFEPVAGIVEIAPGQQTALIRIPVFADGDTESTEGFRLIVTGINNGSLGDDGEVLIALENYELDAPTAVIAPLGQSVPAQSEVDLDASGSSDPQGEDLSFSWGQIANGAPSASLIVDDAAVATVEMPSVATSTDLVFEVTVTNESGLSASDRVTVTVVSGNQAPIATGTANLGFVDPGASRDISITDLESVLVDPEGDTLRITGITQAPPIGELLLANEVLTFSTPYADRLKISQARILPGSNTPTSNGALFVELDELGNQQALVNMGGTLFRTELIDLDGETINGILANEERNGIWLLRSGDPGRVYFFNPGATNVLDGLLTGTEEVSNFDQAVINPHTNNLYVCDGGTIKQFESSGSLAKSDTGIACDAVNPLMATRISASRWCLAQANHAYCSNSTTGDLEPYQTYPEGRVKGFAEIGYRGESGAVMFVTGVNESAYNTYKVLPDIAPQLLLSVPVVNEHVPVVTAPPGDALAILYQFTNQVDLYVLESASDSSLTKLDFASTATQDGHVGDMYAYDGDWYWYRQNFAGSDERTYSLIDDFAETIDPLGTVSGAYDSVTPGLYGIVHDEDGYASYVPSLVNGVENRCQLERVLGYQSSLVLPDVACGTAIFGSSFFHYEGLETDSLGLGQFSYITPARSFFFVRARFIVEVKDTADNVVNVDVIVDIGGGL